MGVLTVKIIKANNLADKDYIGKTDPYVKLELEQDNLVSEISTNSSDRTFVFMLF